MRFNNIKENGSTFGDLIKDYFYSDGRWSWGEVKNLEGYPKGLDNENCDIIAVNDDWVCLFCCGDWQQSVSLRIEKKGKDLRVIPFEDHDTMDSSAIKEKLDEWLN
jgi:hypothetical protein